MVAGTEDSTRIHKDIDVPCILFWVPHSEGDSALHEQIHRMGGVLVFPEYKLLQGMVSRGLDTLAAPLPNFQRFQIHIGLPKDQLELVVCKASHSEGTSFTRKRKCLAGSAFGLMLIHQHLEWRAIISDIECVRLLSDKELDMHVDVFVAFGPLVIELGPSHCPIGSQQQLLLLLQLLRI